MMWPLTLQSSGPHCYQCFVMFHINTHIHFIDALSWGSCSFARDEKTVDPCGVSNPISFLQLVWMTQYSSKCDRHGYRLNHSTLTDGVFYLFASSMFCEDVLVPTILPTKLIITTSDKITGEKTTTIVSKQGLLKYNGGAFVLNGWSNVKLV